MSRIRVLPHPDASPEGAEFDAIVNKQIAANVELVKLAGIKVN